MYQMGTILAHAFNVEIPINRLQGSVPYQYLATNIDYPAGVSPVSICEDNDDCVLD